MSKTKASDCDRNFIEHILSVKNTKDRRHKVITIAGMKFKIKRKKYIQSQMQAIMPLSEYKALKDGIIDFDTISDTDLASFNLSRNIDTLRDNYTTQGYTCSK